MANKKYYKQVEYNIIYSNESIETPVARAAWPSLATPKPGRQFEEGKPPSDAKFEVTLLIPKDGKRTEWFLQELQKQVDEMLALYNEGNPAKLGGVDLLKDGNLMDAEQYPHHQGCWILTARNKKPVRCVDGSSEPKDIDKALIVGGVKVKALVAPYLHSKGLAFSLNIVQLIKDDGVRFGGGVKDFSKMLSACTEEDDAEAGSLSQVQAVISQKMAAAVNKL